MSNYPADVPGSHDHVQHFAERVAKSLTSMFMRRPYNSCWPEDEENISTFIASKMREEGWVPYWQLPWNRLGAGQSEIDQSCGWAPNT